MDLFRAHVLVCGGTGCSSSGSAELIKRFEEQIAKNGLDKEVKVVRTGCFGLCEAGPVVIVYPEGTFYSRIKVDDVDEIVSEHLLKGRIVQHLIYKEKADEEQHSTLENIDFYRPQLRLALRNCGRIDPENIDEYIAFDGYRALGKALTEMTQRWAPYGMQVCGPVGLDLAVSEAACRHKHFTAPGAGQADILLVPTYEVGNGIGKAMSLFGGAKNAGIILGAKVPVVLVSRADSAESKLASIALGAVTAGKV